MSACTAFDKTANSVLHGITCRLHHGVVYFKKCQAVSQYRCKCSLLLQDQYGLPCANFHETLRCSALCAGHQHRISYTLDNPYTKWLSLSEFLPASSVPNFMKTGKVHARYHLHPQTVVTIAPIFRKVVTDQWHYLEIIYTKFHPNP